MANYIIHVDDQLKPEIDSLKNAGSEITGSINTEGDSSLPACIEYRQRCHKIAEIMNLFSNLIQHDTRQLDTFVSTIKATDARQ